MLRWFKNGSRFDANIIHRFGSILSDAETKNIDACVTNKTRFVAVIILLDQMSRHIYRGNKKAFENDEKAVRLVKRHIHKYFKTMTAEEWMFVLLPFQHSTKILDQFIGLRLIKLAKKIYPDNTLLKLSFHVLYICVYIYVLHVLG